VGTGVTGKQRGRNNLTHKGKKVYGYCTEKPVRDRRGSRSKEQKKNNSSI